MIKHTKKLLETSPKPQSPENPTNSCLAQKLKNTNMKTMKIVRCLYPLSLQDRNLACATLERAEIIRFYSRVL